MTNDQWFCISKELVVLNKELMATKKREVGWQNVVKQNCEKKSVLCIWQHRYLGLLFQNDFDVFGKNPLTILT